MAVARNRPGQPLTRLRLVSQAARESCIAVWLRGEGAFVALAVLVGLAARLFYVLRADFPLADGGMFYQMTEELQAAGYRLPEFTAYNNAGVPYVYPPLGFYVTAAIADLTAWSTIDLFRFLPLVVSTLTIPAFALLARELLPSQGSRRAAVFVFALLPEAIGWVIMGGGITRSFGFLFALLALRQIYVGYAHRRLSAVPLAVLWSSLTVLSHAETAWLVVFSSGVFFVAHGRHRTGVAASVLIAAGVAVITAPWWGLVLARHGLDPLLAAGQTGGLTISTEAAAALVTFDFTKETVFPLMGALALLGGVACWALRRPLLVYWLLIMPFADGRALPRHATLPLAMLAGVAVGEVLLPLLRNWRTHHPPLLSQGDQQDGAPHRSLLTQQGPALLCIMGLLYVATSTLTMGPQTMGALTADDREAMRWVATNTPESSSFLIITGTGWARFGEERKGLDAVHGWGPDRRSEWFPALTGRVSVATPQGREWLPGFLAAQRQYYQAQICARADTGCLDRWMTTAGTEFTHVYLPKQPGRSELPEEADDCCWPLRQSLLNDQRYTLVYDGPAASVFVRRTGDPRTPAASSDR